MLVPRVAIIKVIDSVRRLLPLQVRARSLAWCSVAIVRDLWVAYEIRPDILCPVVLFCPLGTLRSEPWQLVGHPSCVKVAHRTV